MSSYAVKCIIDAGVALETRHLPVSSPIANVVRYDYRF